MEKKTTIQNLRSIGEYLSGYSESKKGKLGILAIHLSDKAFKTANDLESLTEKFSKVPYQLLQVNTHFLYETLAVAELLEGLVAVVNINGISFEEWITDTIPKLDADIHYSFVNNQWSDGNPARNYLLEMKRKHQYILLNSLREAWEC
jgi:hypothetical protein